MVSLKAKKRLTYVTMGAYFFMAGVEYAVILPSAWLYIHERFNSDPSFLGLLLSAYSITGLFAGPLFGRWADKSRKVRIILAIVTLFEIAGSAMYFMGFSAWFLVASRFTAGVGVGGEAVIIAEVARFTTEEERTGVISILIAVRQVSLLIGPGFNFLLTKVNFYLGPFLIDKYSSPGLLMMIIWSIMEILLFTIFTEPETILNKVRVMDQIETKYSMPSEDTYSEVVPSTVTYDDIYTDSTDELRPEQPVPVQNGSAIQGVRNLQGTLGSTPISSDMVAGSVGSSVASIGCSSELIESAERLIQIESSGSSDKSKLAAQPRSKRKRSLHNETLKKTSRDIEEPKTKQSWSVLIKGKLKFLYDEYVREEIVALLAGQFIIVFSQVSLETMVTPITDKYLHWNEFQNSLLYCGAGVEVILVFLLTRYLSRRISDRWLLLIGLVILIVSSCWLTYFLPSCTVDTPMRSILGMGLGVFLDMIALPFLSVCSVSLYSKLTKKETQGASQGIRRSIGGIGFILAPIWAGSTINMPYVLFGVLLSLLAVSLGMFVLSFSRLKVPESQADTPKESPEEQNEEQQPLLA